MAHIIQSRAHAEVHDLLKRAAEDATPAARSILEDLVRRQSTGSDSSCPDQATGLTGGAIAGIVIGSVFGVLLLLWIIRSCMNPGAPPQEPRRSDRWYDDVEPRRTSRHSHHSHRHSRPEVISTTGATPVVVRNPSRSPRRPSGTYVVDNGRRGRSSNRYYSSS